MTITTMACSTSLASPPLLKLCPPKLTTTTTTTTNLHLSSSTRKATSSLKLSSSRCISSFSPLLLNKPFTFPSQSQQSNQPRSLTVVAAKGYKMKTHKASAKRFRVSGGGKIMRRRAGKQHLNRKKNSKRRLRLSKMVQVDRSDYNNVIGALPYLKVNREN